MRCTECGEVFRHGDSIVSEEFRQGTWEEDESKPLEHGNIVQFHDTTTDYRHYACWVAHGKIC